MNLEEYKFLAEKTLSTGFHSNPKLEKILHASLGLATEIEELLINYVDNVDPTNILEEVGDLCWYLSIFYREYPEIDESPKSSLVFEENTPEVLIMNMLKSILKIQDIVKKKLYYNKEINKELLSTLVSLIDSDIKSYLGHYSLNIEAVWEKNIAKLKARYGDKFTSERAINRDLETEKKILEN